MLRYRPRLARAVCTPTLLTAVLALLVPAHAQVVGSVSMDKEVRFVQTRDGAADLGPFTPYAFLSGLFVTNPGDASQVVLTYSGPKSPLTLLRSPDGKQYSAGPGPDVNSVFSFATQTELDAAFPDTAYTLTLSGGTLGTLTDTLTFPTNYAPSVPTLTGTTYSRSQGMSATQDFLVTLSGSTPPPVGFLDQFFPNF